jgi:hypothetical protein
LTLANATESALDPLPTRVNPHRPLGHLSGLRQRQRFPQWKRRAEFVINGQSVRVHAHANVCLLVDHRRNPRRMAVARIGQHQFSGSEAETPELLGCAHAFRRGEIEIIALPELANAGCSESATGFPSCPVIGPRWHPAGAPSGHANTAANRLRCLPTTAGTTVSTNPRHLANDSAKSHPRCRQCLLHRRFPQRPAAAHMQQQRTQKGLHRPEAA